MSLQKRFLLSLLFLSAPVAAQSPTVLNGHTRDVEALAISPDGKFALSGCVDGTARLWDLKTHTCLATLEGHSGPVQAVAFSPDGKTLATGEIYKKLKLWDFDTKKETRTIEDFEGAVLGIVFSADSSTLFAACRDNVVIVIDAATGKRLRSLRHNYEVTTVVLSKDGKLVATGDAGGHVRIFAPDGTEPLHATECGSQIQALVFHPDGSKLFVAAADSTIRAIDPAKGGFLKDFAVKEIDARGLALTPDGARLVAATQDSPVRIFDVAKGTELATLQGHDRPVLAVCVTPDGARAVTCSRDTTLRIWSLAP